jgi:hypothetical protein
MARKFLTAIDLAKNELQNARIQNLGSYGANPTAGTEKGLMYFNSTDNTLYWWDGTQWIAAKAAAGATPAGSVTTQAVGDAPVVGVSTNFAREDHKHGRESFGAVTAQTAFGAAAANGAAVTLARSDHVHGTPVHDAAAHSTIPISALAAATANINLGGFKATNSGAPTAGSDLATKTYVDNAVAGLAWKDSVRAATAGAPPPLTGLQTVDGVALVAGDRVLIKDGTAAERFIYVVSASTWTIAEDNNTEAELVGAAVFVSEGTVNADTAWVMTNNAPITPGLTGLTWAQFAGGGAVTAGAGMTQSGNVLDVVAANSSIFVAANDIQVNYAGTAGEFGSSALAARSDHHHDSRYITSAGTAYIGTAGAGLTKTGTTVDVIAGDATIVVAADSITRAALTGDVTTAINAATIANGVVTNAKLATMPANTFKANNTAGVAAPQDITVAAMQATLGIRGALTGDVTSPAGSNAMTIANDVVTNSKLANMPALTIKGNNTASAADPVDITKTQFAGMMAGMMAQTFTANVGGATSAVVNHALGHKDLTVQVYRIAAPFDTVECDVERTDANNITLRFAVAPAANEYRVVVVG